MAELQVVISDFIAEGDELDRLISNLSDAEWALDTPAAGWTVAHQVAHLAATFRMAALSASDADAFRALVAGLGPDFDANVRAAMGPYLAQDPATLLSSWRTERVAAAAALAKVPAGQPVPWLVRPLPAPVLAAAGIMELFGHGQDIADALGVRRTHTDRLRHLVAFAIQNWDFAYLVRGLTPPPEQFRFDLDAPSGARWEFGSPLAEQKISGPAVDFCLLVTRRRHRDDLRVAATGADADAWLDIAQAYRGPAGPGREPGQFPATS